MVAYVLLIVIAISLSVIVYSFLKLYIPKYQTPQCPENVALSIQEYSCIQQDGTWKLSVTLLNKGLYSVDGTYLRVGPEGGAPRSILASSSDAIFDEENYPGGLEPGGTYQSTYDLDSDKHYGGLSTPGEITLEVEPVKVVERKLAVCERAIIRQKITCLTS